MTGAVGGGTVRGKRHVSVRFIMGASNKCEGTEGGWINVQKTNGRSTMANVLKAIDMGWCELARMGLQVDRDVVLR